MFKSALIRRLLIHFSDSVMSVCLTKNEIFGGSVDGTVRTFDIHIGSYVVLCLHVEIV